MTTLDVDKLFVSKIIQERDITPVADIPPQFVFDPDYRKAFEYIRDYYANHSEVPTVRVMLADCPTIKLVQVDEPWDDLIERIQTKFVAGILEQGLDDVVTKYDEGNIKDAVNLLGVIASRVHTAVPSSRDKDITQTGDERLARYLERRNNPGTLVGVPLGFKTIDKATQGAQRGQLITLTGLAKASKSTLAMVMAIAAQKHGSRVLYFTYEQTVEEQERRYDAYNAGINENLLNSGTASNEDWAKVTESIQRTSKLEPLTIIEDAVTVTAIGAKCDIYDPEIVIVDGVYMMEDEHGETPGSAQALANIVKGLKFMAMRRKICIIAVTQSTPARAKGETLNNDSIMGSRAFVQYSNVVIGIERDPEDVKARKVKIIMSRSCSPCTVMAEWDYDTGTFAEIEGYDPDDLDEELEGMINEGWNTDSF